MSDENLSSITSVDQFRQLLVLNAQLKESAGSLKDATKQSEKEIGVKLSQLLLKKNGLFSFLVACGDLGGDSFWQNSAALSAVVKILVTKPSQVKSADKYYAYILHQLFFVFKNPVWSHRLGLLFALAVEEFGKMAPLSVRVEVIDRILRPFDIVLERGNLLLPSAEDEDTDRSARALWTRHVDEALWTAARWFDSISSTGPFTGHASFQPLMPFWLNLLGQAETLSASVAAQAAGTSDGAAIDTPLSALIRDLRTVCRRLIFTSPNSTEQADRLLNNVLLRSNETMRHAYFELDIIDTLLITKISSKIQIVSSDEDSKRTSSSNYTFKYANVKLFVREEPHSVQYLVDFTFGALEAIILKLPNADSCRLLTALLSATFAAYRTTNPLEPGCSGTVAIDPSAFRFTPVDDAFFNNFAKNEDNLFLPHYILSNLLRIFSDFNFDKAEEMGEQVCLELLEVAENISAVYKSEFSGEKATTARRRKPSMVSVVSDRGLSSAKLPNGRLYELLNEVKSDDGNPSVSDDHAFTFASRGAALIELAKGLRHRDRTLFGDEDFERVYQQIIEQLDSRDTFVFLTAINALAELAYWRTDVYLPRMIDAFLDSKTSNSQSLSTESETVNADDHRLMIKGKLGEVIAKVCRQLGDFSVAYFDKISNGLLASLRNSDDEILRCSALSALADLVHACRGRYFDKILQELLLCVSQLLEAGGLQTGNGNSNLERRGAIYLLRSMLQSANNQPNGSVFDLFVDSLVPLTSKLKFLWHNDYDDVVRLHAELALIEIEDAVSRAFNLNSSNHFGRINLER